MNVSCAVRKRRRSDRLLFQLSVGEGWSGPGRVRRQDHAGTGAGPARHGDAEEGQGHLPVLCSE